MVGGSGWGHYNDRMLLAARLVERGWQVVFASPKDEHVQKIESLGFGWVEWKVDRRSVNPLSELAAIRRLASIYRDEQPELVQHFTIKPILYGTIAARLANIPCVVNTFTGVGFPFLGNIISLLSRPVLSPVLGYLLHRPGVTTVLLNEDDRRTLVDRGVAPSDRSIVILGNGIDTNQFAPSAQKGSNETPRVLMVSRLLSDKGVEDYLAAARTLHQRGVKARFQLAGSPDFGSRLSITRKQFDRWQREGDVELLGFRSDVPELITESDIAVLPSHHEGLPRFLVEAASSGLPLVATDVVGCRTVVVDGVNGLLVPPRNPTLLADALSKLICDPELRSTYGAAGRQMALDLFDQDKVIPQYVELFETAMSSMTIP